MTAGWADIAEIAAGSAPPTEIAAEMMAGIAEMARGRAEMEEMGALMVAAARGAAGAMVAASVAVATVVARALAPPSPLSPRELPLLWPAEARKPQVAAAAAQLAAAAAQPIVSPARAGRR